MSPLTDAQREERFAELYRRHSDRVFGLCLRMTGDDARAADLSQDIFVRVWRNMARLRADADAGGWVWRLAVNVALNGIRSDRRLRAREEAAARAKIGPSVHALSTPVPLRRLAIQEAVKTLPPRARRVYILHDVEGHSHEEIAVLLGIAAGTVRGQLHRARRLMRVQLDL